MPDRSKDRAIDGLARRQQGVFHLRQAVSKGFTRAERRSRLGNGTWVRLLDSQVFALPSHPGTWLRQCAAATLSVPGSAISGPSAAALHGFGFPRAGIEVATRHGTTHRSPFAVVRESRTLGPLTVIDGIRVVSAADCLVQIAPLVGPDGLGAILDTAAADRHPHLVEDFRDVYPWIAGSRLPGIAAIREVLAERGPGVAPPRNELERRLRAVLRAARAPSVCFEATPSWAEPGTQRVDALVEPWRLVVEGDGRAWHTRVADFERDRERDAVALAHGYATLRFTWHQLVERPQWCRTILVATGAQRSGPAGAPPTVQAGSM